MATSTARDVPAHVIGLSAGQSIDWTARDGRVHRLTVESVETSFDTPKPAAPIADQQAAL